MGYKNWMLVEGRNDQYVLRDLLRQHHISCIIPDRPHKKSQPDDIVIDQQGSVQGVLDALEIVLDDGDLQNLAIVVDADTNLVARWDALKNIFARFGGEDVPDFPLKDGTIITLTRPYRKIQVGIWLMPDNQVPGILEDFFRFLMPNTQEPLWHHVHQSVDGIPVEQRLFSNIDLPKVQLHTWLAWQKEPGKPLGLAITAKYLDVNTPYGLRLINWVKQTFNLTEETIQQPTNQRKDTP